MENNKGQYSDSMIEELERIDAYTEQALFYARSNYVEKDYVLKKNLSEAGMYRSDSEKPASSAERENSNQPS